ncbi:MAG: hypothetical protein MUF42_08495 [Cytophagaceae bacterium]|jgi:hypothetical protein|nr:hypothetical protein [Cytophagaceae bacterium]
MKRILCMILFALQGIAYAQELRFEVLSGPVYNFPSPLKLVLDGQDPMVFRARYRSEPFKLPPYYDFRLTRWKDKWGFGLKFTHHKLILDNPQDPIQFFEITHGYNILSFTGIRSFKYFNANAALGVVIAHPQSTINGIRYRRPGFWGGGYLISGAVAELAISKSITLYKGLYATAEFRGTTAWARVPVANGYADAPNTALHALIGVGYTFWKRKQ